MFTALLDSCVLWPSTLRDFLLSLAIEQAYTPAWSSAILDEVGRNEAVKLSERGRELCSREAAQHAAVLVRQMRAMFPDAETQGWEPLEGSFGLPDIEMNPQLALKAIREMIARSGRHGPKLDEGSILDILEQRYSLHEAAVMMRATMAL